MSRAELFEQAKALPLEDRIELVNQLRETIADEDLTEEQVAELERRAEHARKHPETCTPWEEVRADLKRRHGWP